MANDRVAVTHRHVTRRGFYELPEDVIDAVSNFGRMILDATRLLQLLSSTANFF
jgi:hypothetical protein